MRQLLIRLTHNRSLWRLLLAMLFIMPLLLTVPHLRSLVVRNAVVTAYFSSMRAPIDGDVVEIAVSPGQSATEGQPAMRILNPRIDNSRVTRLEVLRDETARRITRHQEAVAELRRMTDARQADLGRYSDSLFDEMETQKKVHIERAAAHEAAVAEAENSLARAQKLRIQNNASGAAVDEAKAKYQDAFAARAQNALKLQRVSKQIDDLREGIYQTEIPDGALQTLFLAQELGITLIHLEGELGNLESQLHATEAELGAAKKASKRQHEATVQVPAGMTIWHVDVTEGSSVTAGTKLLSYVDCSNLLVDIAVDDATLELIEPGRAVRLRLFGRPGYVDGVVRLVRGSGGLNNSDDLAATVQERGARTGRVLATVNDAGLASDSRRTCGIGRTAFAEFEGISFFETVFLPLLR